MVKRKNTFKITRVKPRFKDILKEKDRFIVTGPRGISANVSTRRQAEITKRRLTQKLRSRKQRRR